MSPSGTPAASFEAPSVVVDPSSQVPEVPAAPGARRTKGVEPTEILKGRRLDALRAEVAQRRKAHRRKQLGILLFWGLAGAVALCLGWLAGRAFTPEAETKAGDAAQDPAAAPTEGTPTPSGASPGNTPPSAPVAPPSAPADDRAQGAAPTPPPASPAPEPAEARPADTFTLDDLPVE